MRFALEGANIAITDIVDNAEFKETVKEIAAFGVKAKGYISDASLFVEAENVIDDIVNDFGTVDILVNNAGITRDTLLMRMTEEQWDRVIEVNLKGYFNFVRQVAPLFKEQKSGKIINITSINGLRGKHSQTNYSASKGGIVAMSKALAREVGKFNVNVNVLAPGMVLTAMAEALPPEFLEQATDETVLGRLASPEDCANAVLFLCSDRSRHITGEVLKVDGGQYI